MKKSGLLQIHIAVFLFGFAGLFGKFLTCSPFYIVLGRTLFGGLALGLYARGIAKIHLGEFNRTALFFLICQGLLLASHWVLFFVAIQVSSVALGLVTFSSFPLFVTFMEPLFFKEPLRRSDILTALALFAGIILVVPDLNLANTNTLGAFYGILSGLTFALLALVNRKNARAIHPVTVAFWQNTFAALFLFLPVILFRPAAPGPGDLPLLVLLGVVFTAFAHTCFIGSLSHIRAQTASVIAGLEPVYGIVLAFCMLGEIPAPQTLAGGAIIIGTTVAAGWLSTSN